MQRQGGQILYATELNSAVNYAKLHEFLMSLSDFKHSTSQVPNISRETLKIVCDLALSDKDKQLIKYAVCCTKNKSAQAERKAYGISNLTSLKQNAESAVEQAMEIRDAVNYLSSVKESCILEELGIHIDDSTSDIDVSKLSETCESDGNDGCDDVNSENDHLLMMLRENNNWFAFVKELKMMPQLYI